MNRLDLKKRNVHIISIVIVSIFSWVAGTRWLLNIESFHVLGRDIMHMPFTTSLSLFLLGLAYWMRLIGKRSIQVGILVVVVLMGVSGMLQNLFGTLVSGSERFVMSTAEAFGLLALVASFLLIDAANKVLKAMGQYGFHIVTLVSFFIVLSFIFGQAADNKFAFLSSMNFWSAVAFHIISISATFINPTIGFTGLLLGKGPGNQVARNMFLMMVTTVVVSGFTILRLGRLQLLSFDSGILFFGVVVLILCMTFLFIVAIRLNRSHKLRLAADSKLRQINANLEMKILERTAFIKETLELLNDTNRVAKIGGWDVNLTDRRVNWTPITKMIHEVPPDYLPDLETSVSFFKSGTSRAGISKAINNAISMGVSWDLELEIVTAKGNEKWIRSIGKPTFRNGECVKINGTFQDVDSRRKAEFFAKKESQFLQAIVDNIPLNIYAKDLESKKILINKQELSFMGLKDSKEVLGKSDYDLFPKASADISRAEDVEIFRTKKPIVNRETYLKQKDGQAFWFLTSKIPLINDEGMVTGLIGLSVDITQRKLDEEKLKKYAVLEAGKMQMEQFGNIASHDLRVPILSIKNHLHALLQDFKGQLDADGRGHVVEIQRRVAHMDQLVGALSTYSQLSSPTKMVTTDFGEVLKLVLEKYSQEIAEVEADVKVGSMPVLLACPDQIHLLFEALISNALKFRNTELMPEIEIQSGENPESWLFYVRDNGIGIPEKEMDNVFTLFKRLQHDISYPGIGAGLANVRKIAEQHGGRVWAESEEGIGSVFCFELPTRQVK